MRKKAEVIYLFFFLSMILVAQAQQTQITRLPGIMKPVSFYLDDNQMYVVEGVSIFIYNLKDFRLVKKIGKPGEGPTEMMLNPQYGPLFLDISGNELLVHSFSKLTYFTKEGDYRSETRLPNPLIFRLTKFGQHLIASRLTQEENQTIRTLVVFDQEFNKVRDIVKTPHEFTSGKGWKVLDSNPITFVHQDKLFYGWENQLHITVIDTSFNTLYSIAHDIPRIKVTEKDKQVIIDYIKTDPRTKPIYEQLKPIIFPDYFPAMVDVFPDGDKLYIQTFNKKEKRDTNHYEFHILDTRGKYLQSIFLPLKMMNPLRAYPTRIRDGYLLQIVEDIEKEQWVLHKTKIQWYYLEK